VVCLAWPWPLESRAIGRPFVRGDAGQRRFQQIAAQPNPLLFGTLSCGGSGWRRVAAMAMALLEAAAGASKALLGSFACMDRSID